MSSLERSDLVSFYSHNYTAQQAAVSIVGDLTRAQAEALAQQLTSSLPSGAGVAALGVPQLPAASEPVSYTHLDVSKRQPLS